VHISPAALAMSEQAATSQAPIRPSVRNPNETTGPDGQPLTEREQSETEELRETDRRVHEHEEAHLAAGGQHIRGGATYEYENGPDGLRYAVDGEVRIDTSVVPGDPQATITKMQQVRRAALAPNDPSPEDRQVAADAQAKEATARRKLADQQREDMKERAQQFGTSEANPDEATQEAGPFPTSTRETDGGLLAEPAGKPVQQVYSGSIARLRWHDRHVASFHSEPADERLGTHLDARV
jgi:hypothetical protein